MRRMSFAPIPLPLDFDGHCATHQDRAVECIECGAAFVCLPASDLWHCPTCFDGACNGRCTQCHARHRRDVHRDGATFAALTTEATHVDE